MLISQFTFKCVLKIFQIPAFNSLKVRSTKSALQTLIFTLLINSCLIWEIFHIYLLTPMNGLAFLIIIIRIFNCIMITNSFVIAHKYHRTWRMLLADYMISVTPQFSKRRMATVLFIITIYLIRCFHIYDYLFKHKQYIAVLTIFITFTYSALIGILISNIGFNFLEYLMEIRLTLRKTILLQANFPENKFDRPDNFQEMHKICDLIVDVFRRTFAFNKLFGNQILMIYICTVLKITFLLISALEYRATTEGLQHLSSACLQVLGFLVSCNTHIVSHY